MAMHHPRGYQLRNDQKLIGLDLEIGAPLDRGKFSFDSGGRLILRVVDLYLHCIFFFKFWAIELRSYLRKCTLHCISGPLDHESIEIMLCSNGWNWLKLRLFPRFWGSFEQLRFQSSCKSGQNELPILQHHRPSPQKPCYRIR